MQILDRSYYDALGNFIFMQKFQWVLIKNKSEMLLENVQKNITLIEIQDQDNDLKRLMWVNNE